MHVLIIGIAGSGKSYLVEKLKEKGVNAVDVDSSNGLVKFVDEQGNRVEYDRNGGTKWWANHYYVLDVELLKKLLKETKTVYIFGHVGGQPGKGNGFFDVINLFDKVYYLKAPKELLANRLKNRTNNIFGKHPEEVQGLLEYKDSMDEKARKLGIQFIDVMLPVEKIIEMILS
jgi:shikimate kinase